ncbi:hypothetical protein SAICODRAFT_30281 [Saitoella complicata NRRL Y-17804]|uniref:uncharacterized protein n=1 Tax=Saitoella complicata (strain BCRC 22490 / CBS 7301 / JCM 7358 / NBRC 10748 / NRRL Y-17804) TaxID=698492 RepID=UPI0008678DBF|nr:uncharacterized protein SAICODRAFT_30281 [Saitoella complicata NRRL Y-17804]ODQ53238.1 hypothetical protein SAICODRAFT_30281 [Saitoella complicata NRRL Y-17804]
MGSARGLFGSTAISSKDSQTSYLGHFSSPVTSLNVSQSGHTIICTSLGNERGLAALQVWKNAPRDPAEQGVSAGETGLGLSVVFTPTNKGSLWTSTISKHDENTYAIGGTRLLMIARHTFDSGADTRRAQHKLPVRSDVFSTMFLEPDVLAAGCRDGTVQLFDTRVREAGVMKLRHGSSVTHMRNVQDHCLVVNGLQGSLEMYDLRAPRPHAPSASFGRQTDPVVSYQGHQNSHTFQLGFDVDAALGVVAAAGDDGSVRLWSLYTGTSLDTTKLNRGRKPTQIQTLRFFHTAEQEDTRLLIATRDIVESWGCWTVCFR